ncbi:choice-of-anchor D domain-containing protein [Amycolatopsis sp. OK19-0408]|uniref:Choice-of-anchor D domain-containing protein n=1 Tax=Amycolatopsis iheyensis TaxID=2945988 RepID=A0A9X2NK17_9PSEU|nr:choice-of-anchor D domain-containing protein [Amycolatopsis iheyensis]MCR6487832.1 choice-of-anchor D domain-containing protein [Amycolatopsis iheyensis]
MTRRSVALVVASALAAGQVAAWGAVSPGGTEVLSVADNGVSGTGADPAVSASGRYVAFSSRDALDPLVTTDELSDVYVRDRWAPGRTVLISRGYPIYSFAAFSASAFEAAPNGDSGHAAISADGRYVAFETAATNIPDGYDGFRPHIVVADRDPDGDGVFDELRPDGGMDYRYVPLGRPDANLDEQPDISGDGTTVAWTETMPGEPRAVVVARLAKDPAGRLTPPDRTAYVRPAPGDRPRVSADGALVAFSQASCDCPNRTTSVWEYDIATAATSRVDVPASGDASRPSVSGDGRLIAFEQRAPDGTTRVVTVERGSPPRVRVAAVVGSPALSADGRYLTGLSAGAVVVRDLIVDTERESAGLDRLPDELASPSAGACGTCPADGPSSGPALSGDGSVAVFASAADDLVAGRPGCCAGAVFARAFRPTLTAPATDFGAVTAGEPADRTLSLQHSGFGPLAVGEVTVAGPDFTVTAQTCAGATLYETGSCLVAVSFRPASPGRKDAELRIVAGGTPVSVALTGNAGEPLGGLTAEPASLGFGGPVPALSPAGSRTVRIGSTGGVPIALGDVSIAAGPRFAAEDFRVTATTCAHTTLAPGGSCTVEVAATPRGAGPRTAALLVRASPPELSRMVPLRDEGNTPTVTASPAVARPRRVIQVAGAGFPVSRELTVLFGGVTTVARTDPAGVFGTAVLVPAHTDVGTVPLVATAVDVPLTARTSVLVQPGTYQPPGFTSRR